MHIFAALASALLFLSSLSLAVSDAAWAARADAAAPAPAARQTLAYGPDRAQTLDYWPGRGPGAPVVVFVHGGGWKRGDKTMMTGSAKLKDWQAQGYAVAAIDYRLVPQASVEDEAADVAAAVAYLKANGARLGLDPHRIVLVGHSAGAHLVALVGTDPTWLGAVGLKLSDLRGIVSLDGAAYDVPRQLEIGAPLMHQTYLQAFGADPARQKRLSPTLQAGLPNAPEFLILHVQRADGVEQSEALAAALRKAGTKVTIEGFAGAGLRGHMEINQRLGGPDYPATPVVDAFLKRVLG